MIAVTLTKPSDMPLANASTADFIEVRSDLYPKVDFYSLLGQSEKPVIFTIKEPHLETLSFIHHPRIAYVDLDYKLSELWPQNNGQCQMGNTPPKPSLILSYHDYKKTPPWKETRTIVSNIESKNPYKIKLAFQINEFKDLLVIAKLQEELAEKAIIIGMGKLGQITRLYNRAWLTYACLNEEEIVAPGQIPIDQMKTKQIFGLLGKGIDYSLSPRIYETAFAYHHLPHDYLLFDTDHFEMFKEIFQFFKIPACSVTQPYKKDALTIADVASKDAKEIGAANLLIQDEDGKIHAYNSDWIGVQKSLEGKLKNKKILILGKGGAALACKYACKQGGASSCILLGRENLPTKILDYDVLINATPVTDELLVTADSLKSKVVMDCNYKTESVLMQEAQKQGAEVINGLNMLIYQAQKHYDAFCGRELPIEKIKEIIHKDRRRDSISSPAQMKRLI